MNHEILIEKHSEDPFSRVPKTLADDPRLTWKGKGLMAYLLGKPANWVVSITDLVNHSPDGEKSTRSGLLELRMLGYAKLEEVRDGGKILKWVTRISDIGGFPKYVPPPKPEKPKKKKVKSPDAGFGNVEPDAGFLHVEKLQVENGHPSKKDLYQDRKVNKKDTASLADEIKSIELPEKLRTEDFKSSWESWILYRLKGKRVKDFSDMFRDQLAAMEKVGPEASIYAINLSIMNRWQGVFPKPLNGHSSNGNGKSTVNGSGLQKPNPYHLQKQVEGIEYEISIHPANHLSTCHRQNCSQAEKDELKKLRQSFEEKNRQFALI